MNHIDDHPQRYALANELHARPFPALEANSRAVHLAILREGDMLEEGRIRESGTHSELLAAGGLHASLYRMQFNEPGLGGA